ncbi:MAG: hypothetical protein UHS41_02455 [Lachnospiraceae bacterium]|nr:hypothetical protein [Lachnospiraceae bacterium]
MMKLGMEMMVSMLLLLTGILFSVSIYNAALEVSDAKQYHVWVMERLEGSKYARSIKDACQKEAKELGYELSMKEETIGNRDVWNVTLSYFVILPFLGTERQYTIKGYSQNGREVE